MAKDPAFLFYPQDFLVGVMDMTDEEVGVYIRLLCRQHQKGHIPERVILRSPEAVQEKFIKDSTGKYYNERLEKEIGKRRKYTAQRLANLMGNRKDSDMENHIDNHKDSHMGDHMDSHEEHHMSAHTLNENENENKDLNEIEKMNKEYRQRLKNNPNVNQEFLATLGVGK